MKSARAVTHSIRLDSRVYEQLEKKAKEKTVSFNNLVNQVLKKYVEFDQFAVKFGFMMFHRDLVSQQLSTFESEVVASIGETVGKTFAKDVLLTIGLPMNRDSLLYFIETILGRYENLFDCQRFLRDGRELLYLRHSLGEKWSLFLKGYTSAAFKTLLGKEPAIEVSSDGISFAA